MKEDEGLTPAQLNWASKRKHGLSPSKLKELIKKQKGRCALPGAKMFFEKEAVDPRKLVKGELM